MKYIIIGLGTFGASLAMKLTQTGHEIIGVDKDIRKVETYKELITNTVCLDSTDPNVMNNLPISDTDIVIVCIGENEGDSILTNALLKKLKVKRLISRSVSPLHETVLESMGVDEIVHPEQVSAIRLAKSLNIAGVVELYEFSGDYNIVETNVPQKYIGKSLSEIKLNTNFNILILTTLQLEEKENELGVKRKTTEIQGVANSKTILKKDDLIVIYGKTHDIEKFLKS